MRSREPADIMSTRQNDGRRAVQSPAPKPTKVAASTFNRNAAPAAAAAGSQREPKAVSESAAAGKRERNAATQKKRRAAVDEAGAAERLRHAAREKKRRAAVDESAAAAKRRHAASQKKRRAAVDEAAAAAKRRHTATQKKRRAAVGEAAAAERLRDAARQKKRRTGLGKTAAAAQKKQRRAALVQAAASRTQVSTVLDVIARIYDESGFAVSRHSQQLRRLDSASATSETEELFQKVEEDIETYCVVAESDKRRLVHAYTSAMSHSMPLPGCAACGRRDPMLPAQTKVILEDLSDDHWLRYSAEALADLNTMPTVTLVDASGSKRDVSTKNIKNFFAASATEAWHVHPEVIQAEDDGRHSADLCTFSTTSIHRVRPRLWLAQSHRRRTSHRS